MAAASTGPTPHRSVNHPSPTASSLSVAATTSTRVTLSPTITRPLIVNTGAAHCKMVGPLPPSSDDTLTADLLAREVGRRRTFAIISHPDAGKTTLTEKLLLYAGAIELAGAVRGSKTQRHAVSDWMEMEQQRGISISAAALEFELDGHHVTLLDTPGHQDFSEDTYRTLLAVDSVVMVLDAAKGVEPQTLKLFEVCRARGLPVLTFINKLDQPARDPFELLDQIERVLGHLGGADELAARRRPGLPRRLRPRSATRCCSTSARRAAGAPRRSPSPAPTTRRSRSWSGNERQQELIDAVDIITGAGTRFDPDAYRHARQTPVFFGSALNDFGVEPFLHALLTLAPSPGAAHGGRRASSSRPIPHFSGFVFKIQANMNPRHRDRVAFLRICSGRLAKDMAVVQRAARHARCGCRASTGSSAATARRCPRRFRATSSASSIPGASPSATRCTRAGACSFRRSRSSRRSSSRCCGPSTCGTSASTRRSQQLAEEGLLQVFMPIIGHAPPDRRRHRRPAARRDRGAHVVGVRHRVHARSTAARRPRGGRSARPEYDLVAADVRRHAGRRPAASARCCSSSRTGCCATRREEPEGHLPVVALVDTSHAP